MVSQLNPIPKTAPFAEEEIDLLNRVVGSANPIQRAWLAGFLAGLDAQIAAHPKPEPAAPPRTAEPITIVYASESGNSERLAADTAKLARKRGFKPSVVDMADLDLATLPASCRLVVIAATWGEGEPPARATNTYKALMSDGAPRLDGVEFAVLALGDTAYVEFCAIGKAIDARLEALGGKRVAERADLDLDFAEPAARWIDGTVTALAPAGEPDRGQVIAVDFGATAAEPNLGPFEAEVTAHIDLNSSRSDKETIHLELSFDAKAPAYNPGDSLDLYTDNDPPYVDQLLKAAGLSSDAALRDDFLANRDVTTLSLKTVETYAAATGHQYVKALIESGEARNWIAGRQLIDLIEHFPIALSSEHLRSLTRPLAPRGRRRGASAGLGGALREPRPRPQGRGVEPCRGAPQEGQPREGEAAPQQAFRPARRRARRHHGRPRHRHRTVPRLRAGAPRYRRDRQVVAVLRRPQLHARLPLPARVAGRPQGRRAHPHGRRVLARHAREDLRAGPPVGPSPRPGRMARQRRLFLCVRRRQGDGQGRARDAGACLCGREGARHRRRRAGRG